MYHPTEDDHLKALKDQADNGADFGVLARDNSVAPTAGTGGDLGWVAKGQLDDDADRRDLRRADRQDLRGRDGRRRRHVPVQGPRRGDPDAGGHAARGADLDRLLEVVRREEAAARHHPRPGDHGDRRPASGRAGCSTRSSRRRDSAGDSIPRTASRSSRPSRWSAVPIEPSRPLLIVPLATLRASAAPVPAPLPLAGRNGPGGGDPVAVLRRLYPADHPVGRFGADDGMTVAALDAAALGGPLYLAPVAPELAVAGPWAMPWISARLRQPDGCPWDREQTHTSLRKHLLEEAYEVYDALEAGATPELAGELGDLWLQIVLHAQLAAEAGIFDLADVQAAIASQDRPAPPARVRRRRRPDRVRREPAVGADQGRRAGRGGGRRRRRRRAPPRP